MPELYLPGRFRKETQDQERPKDYATVDERGHIIIVANSEIFSQRIPLDELKDMVKDRQAKRAKKGIGQRSDDVNKAMQEWWGMRRQWILDRQRNAVRFGYVPPTR